MCEASHQILSLIYWSNSLRHPFNKEAKQPYLLILMEFVKIQYRIYNETATLALSLPKIQKDPWIYSLSPLIWGPPGY